ncbi:MAG TPA: hypothetical protein VFC78_08685 [Tepidisphaeraceae bacterium]|nr:hypothetical protein [Tepidisphaeraceae bacterium]
MRRRLFTILATLSALLFVATVALWVRSYWYYSYWDSHLYWNNDQRGHREEFWAISHNGGLCYAHCLFWSDDDLAIQLLAPNQHGMRGDAKLAKANKDPASTGFVKRTFGGLGYDWEKSLRVGDLKMTGTSWAVAVPYWGIAAMFAPLPTLWMFALRRARRERWRLRHSRCFRCGYDLRATPGQCPECGTETKKA